MLIATPEFNGSIPGVLKNALDWASRPFPDNALRGMPVAVVGASTGLFGAVWAQAEVRKVLETIGADVHRPASCRSARRTSPSATTAIWPTPACATRSKGSSPLLAARAGAAEAIAT